MTDAGTLRLLSESCRDGDFIIRDESHTLRPSLLAPITKAAAARSIITYKVEKSKPIPCPVYRRMPVRPSRER